MAFLKTEDSVLRGTRPGVRESDTAPIHFIDETPTTSYRGVYTPVPPVPSDSMVRAILQRTLCRLNQLDNGTNNVMFSPVISGSRSSCVSLRKSHAGKVVGALGGDPGDGCVNLSRLISACCVSSILALSSLVSLS